MKVFLTIWNFRGMKGVKHKFEWHCGELPDGWQGLPNNPGLIGLFCFEYDRDYSYPLAVFLHKEFFDAVEVEAGHIRIFWKNVTAAARQAVDELPGRGAGRLAGIPGHVFHGRLTRTPGGWGLVSLLPAMTTGAAEPPRIWRNLTI